MYIPKMAEQIGIPDTPLRELLARLIKRSGKKHPQIAREMSLHTGGRISKRMVDDWLAPSKKGARFPAVAVEAFCEAVGNDELQRHIMGERLRRALAVGEAVLQARPKGKGKP